MNMTMSSVFLSASPPARPPSHGICIKLNIFWDVVVREIHGLKVHQNLCVDGPESRKNVSNILWNPCNKEMKLL